MDTATPRMQIQCEAARPSCGPQRPTTIAPNSGARGTSRYSCCMVIRASPLEPPHFLDVDRADVAKQQDQDRKPDRRFGGGNRQDEEDEHLAGGVAEEARERDEVEVDGEQHELDRHQHDEDVAPVEENADYADRK